MTVVNCGSEHALCNHELVTKVQYDIDTLALVWHQGSHLRTAQWDTEEWRLFEDGKEVPHELQRALAYLIEDEIPRRLNPWMEAAHCPRKYAVFSPATDTAPESQVRTFKHEHRALKFTQKHHRRGELCVEKFQVGPGGSWGEEILWAGKFADVQRALARGGRFCRYQIENEDGVCWQHPLREVAEAELQRLRTDEYTLREVNGGWVYNATSDEWQAPTTTED